MAVVNLMPVLRNVKDDKEVSVLFDREVRRLMQERYPKMEVRKSDIVAALMVAKYRLELREIEERQAGMTKELELQIAKVSGFVKMMTGVANNAALAIMVQCLNKVADVRPRDEYALTPRHAHPNYRHKVKQMYNQVLKERDHYRRALLHPASDQTRFFQMADMPEEQRKMYGIISDNDYFEFWESTGALAEQKSQPLVGSLQNKFRLSLQRHGVANADQVAWAMTGASVLELAVVIWQKAMQLASSSFEGKVSASVCEKLYAPFSLKRVSEAWVKATRMLAPEADAYPLDTDEERNIEMGVEQLMELWVSPDMPFDAVIKAVEDYKDDVFASSGYAKKTIRQLVELRNQAVEEMKNVRRS